MERKKRIAMITVDHTVNQPLREQLIDVFKNEVEVISIYLDDCNYINTKNIDLVVASSKILEDKIKEKINKDIPIVSVRRTINLNNLSEAIGLDTGKNVLLVSNYLQSAKETIDLLKELGIDHIRYYPYYPGCNQEILDTAITPGGLHIIPNGVKRVIDIGVRIIDISSIIEIFLKLNLPTENIPMLSAKYTKDMIRLNKFNSETNKMLRAMFEVTNDGIAALDVSGNIFFCNQKFREIIGYKDEPVISKNIVEIVSDNKLIDIFLEKNQKNNVFVNINDRELMLNKTLLYQGDYLKGHVIGIQETSHIQNLEKEVRKKLITKGFVAKYAFKDLIGESKALKKKIKIAKKIATSDLTVLIQGEDGTGKEIFANAIHNDSKRKNEPFVAVNMASLSDNLLESELFGYEGGSFTGANKEGKPGFFEQAHRGTIFIDEIGDASSKIQMNLLRVLQEKKIIRVGGTKIIPIDVRVIAATNKDLYELVLKGKFRKDLYYRLKVLHFEVPTLKERIDDIELLSKYFFEKLKSNKRLSNNVLDLFKEYSWPGNIRELENLIYYLDNIAEGEVVYREDLPEDFMQNKNDDSLEDMIEILSTSRDKIHVEILKILQKTNSLDMNIGRNRISEILKNKNFDLSPDQVRTKIKELEKIGLVEIGSTKQGTNISDDGKNYLNKINN